MLTPAWLRKHRRPPSDKAGGAKARDGDSHFDRSEQRPPGSSATHRMPAALGLRGCPRNRLCLRRYAIDRCLLWTPGGWPSLAIKRDSARLSHCRILGNLLDRSFTARRYVSYLLTSFSLLALCIAAIGLYGVLSYGFLRGTGIWSALRPLGNSVGHPLDGRVKRLAAQPQRPDRGHSSFVVCYQTLENSSIWNRHYRSRRVCARLDSASFCIYSRCGFTRAKSDAGRPGDFDPEYLAKAANYHGHMASIFLAECLPVLERTPATLNALLRDLPEVWTEATEGPNTWSPYAVLGHVIHGEQTDWLPRAKTILDHGPAKPFEPFDREAQFREASPKTLNQLLDQFASLRHANLLEVRAMNLQPEDLNRIGTHPVFGPVSLRQLLATWTAHDLAHLLQISRVMAKRYREEVGPWAQYLSVMA